ncbi:tRNA lysidine(34) synthetase TilS [Oscillochloris sp. ZM17-4]|uniref:tRNA lysidine(34) synthetase TilS n=1 Tax=Oscillochloris sp. ZM17-4 TaxID=2866714 RepID=UPI001C72F11D|nr:tRNA lysidine(34) synthetase TilS [Oscillochloris sp. ZM17-4]MBX0330639.1 tRNA lysidine(34) synthetase TilS [Oscillochloris sp. ZM17-4]
MFNTFFMHDALTNRVGEFLAAQGLRGPAALIVVAVSGGPDSLCLLHALAALARAGGPRLHVAHLDHGFRGEQSAGEARAVAEAAAGWGIPASIARADVPALARASGEGAQAAARRARYNLLAQVARDTGAQAVAVAHTADDQAETVLLHALRGAGPAGLRGMRPVVGWGEWAGGMLNVELRMLNAEDNARHSTFHIPHSTLLIRPLLDTSRAEVLAYCAAHGLSPADDPSNRSPRYARSRVRQRLLPALAEENPQVVAALGRTARICADDYDFMQRALDAAWPALAVERPGSVALGLAAWRDLHPALRRYALRRAAARLGAPELSFPQVEAARAAIDAGSPRRVEIAGGLSLEFGYNSALIRAAGAPPEPDTPQLAGGRLALVAPGRTPLGGGWACVAAEEPPAQPSPWWVAVSAELAGELALRRRRPGDRIRPAGGRGGRRLQDFFVDRKVPRRLRDAWPILVAGEAILWVAGLRADARAGGRGGAVIWVGIVRETE